MEVFIVTYFGEIHGVFDSEDEAAYYIDECCECDSAECNYNVEPWLVGTGID